MASLKEIRTRIASITSTRQITSAMKMVSAAKLRKAQDAITQLRPYADKLYEILQHLAENLDAELENIYAQKREPKNILIILICSNRGLCGAFNANVVKKGIELANTKYKEQLENENVHFVVVGKKAYDLLKARQYEPVGAANDLYNDLTFDNVAATAEGLMESFVDGTYDSIELIYNSFRNAANQDLTVKQFLPITVEERQKDEAEKQKRYYSNYLFEPDKKYIVDVLIPKSLKIQFFKALLESYASEHGARMTSMHKATDNATELLKNLKIDYNKARQSSITNEILEIVAGAEALK